MKEHRRLIFLVRHGERMDNVDSTWKMRAPRWDDPPLSARGKRQATEVGKALAGERIDYIFSSPFTRTLQTALGIVAVRGGKLCVEPGLAESLNATSYPPGYPDPDERRELCSCLDESYRPVMASLPPETGGDTGCYDRVAYTIAAILARTRGHNIAIVSHGSPIAAAHLFLFGEWAYVGQCTVSRVREVALNQFEKLSVGSSDHLSEPWDLHAVQSKAGETEKGKALERAVRRQRGQAEKEKQTNSLPDPESLM